MSEIRIRRFAPGDEPAFYRLNEAWIERYFHLEAKDRKMLDDPTGQILEPGGDILVAEDDGVAIGCCALIPMPAGTYELAKMAVSDSHQGRGIGRKLIEAVIARAREMGARRLFLETNGRMAPAIHLYESVGFVHVKRATPSEYDRSDVCMEMPLEGISE
jgi:N-acetylglutamate synthase-like GNAT family acetyltransferase